eukprot:2510019-Prymnesium_polylepis.1
MAAAAGAERVWCGTEGLLSTPAMSAVIRSRSRGLKVHASAAARRGSRDAGPLASARARIHPRACVRPRSHQISR